MSLNVVAVIGLIVLGTTVGSVTSVPQTSQAEQDAHDTAVSITAVDFDNRWLAVVDSGATKSEDRLILPVWFGDEIPMIVDGRGVSITIPTLASTITVILSSTETDGQPGFGIAIAIVAIVIAAILARLRS